MPSWPFTRLHIGTQHSIAISGPFIQVIHSEDGQVSHIVRCDVIITTSAVDEKFIHLATIGDDKKLQVWDIASLQLKSTRELPKKATQLSFFKDEIAGTSIVIADKFGDVFSYPLIARPITDTKTSGRESLASHENPHGDLILGHASIITCFTFSADKKYIITADRDEHIRISRFPRGYIIERYCLGHGQFVSAINVPSFDPSVLISGGGDPYLSVWDWKTGREKCRIPASEALKPYLKGTPTRVRWKKKKSHPTTKRRRNKNERALEEELEVEQSIDLQSEPPKNDREEAEPMNDIILAVKKVTTVEMEHIRLILFSAIGGSALCYCEFTEDPHYIPSIRHLDMDKPILDFELTTDRRILVTLDPNWNDGDFLEETSTSVVECAFQFPYNALFFLGRLHSSDKPSRLVETLNGHASQTASAHEIVAMRLYDDLELLRKRPDGPEEDEAASRPSTPTPTPTPTPSTSAPTGKMAARLKKQSHIRQQGAIKALEDDSRGVAKKMKLGEEQK